MRLVLPLLAAALAVGACASSSGGKPPETFVQSTAESRATRMLDVRDGLSHQQAMRLLTETLEKRYIVDITDPRVGFAMTAWRASLVRDGVPDLRYRTRLTARFLGDDWRRLQLRGEANWAHDEEWDVGFDTPQLDSAASEVNAKLGSRP
jgi:RES domain-containing protein